MSQAQKKGTTKKAASKGAVPPAKRKRGRPSEFDNLDMDKVRKLAEKGWTDKEMADFFGVTKQTWDNWKKANPDFFASLVDWKAGADERVERSLYERAVGYEHEDTYFANFQGSIITQTYTKHYPPDTRACQYWLNNRQRDKWRNYAPVENTDDELKPKITEREFVD